MLLTKSRNKHLISPSKVVTDSLQCNLNDNYTFNIFIKAFRDLADIVACRTIMTNLARQRLCWWFQFIECSSLEVSRDSQPLAGGQLRRMENKREWRIPTSYLLLQHWIVTRTTAWLLALTLYITLISSISLAATIIIVICNSNHFTNECISLIAKSD